MHVKSPKMIATKKMSTSDSERAVFGKATLTGCNTQQSKSDSLLTCQELSLSVQFRHFSFPIFVKSG